MTNGMIHEEFHDAVAAEAVDALDGEERERLLAHLGGCASCSAELESLRRSAALLAFAAPHRPMEPARSAAVRSHLLARAAEDRETATQVGPASPAAATSAEAPLPGDDPDVTLVGAPPPPIAPAPTPAPVDPPPMTYVRREPDVIPITSAPRRRAPLLPWLAAAASLVLLIGVGMYAASLRGRLATAEDRYQAAERERFQLERRLRESDATLAAVTAPASRVIELAAARPQAPSGRMFWDVAHNRWTFFAHHLPAVREGREYQLWLITADQRRIPAGTFRPDATGHAVVQATYALSPDSLGAIAVTEEPAGGLPQPSGPIVIAGAAAEAEE